MEANDGLCDRYPNQLECYVQLKIIEAQINTCVRERFLPGIFSVFVVVNIISSYFCASNAIMLLLKAENFIFPCALVDSTFLILFLAGLCGMLNKKSVFLLNRLKVESLNKVLDRKLFCKRVRGCSSMKVRFGSNFVDVLTPLRMMVLCIKGMARLLLLQ